MVGEVYCLAVSGDRAQIGTLVIGAGAGFEHRVGMYRTLYVEDNGFPGAGQDRLHGSGYNKQALGCARTFLRGGTIQAGNLDVFP